MDEIINSGLERIQKLTIGELLGLLKVSPPPGNELTLYMVLYESLRRIELLEKDRERQKTLARELKERWAKEKGDDPCKKD